MWFVIAAMFLFVPIVVSGNLISGEYVASIVEWVVFFGLIVLGLFFIVLGIVQDGKKYVMGTLVKKSDWEYKKSDSTDISDISGRKMDADAAIPDVSTDTRFGSTRIHGSSEENLSPNVIQSDLENNFQRFSWENMEDIASKLFEQKGYSTQVGVPSPQGMKRNGDFGIDVRASSDVVEIGIQVKHHSSNVDFDTIAKTIGVSQDFDKVIVISTKTGFTSQAVTFANNEKKLDLWDSNRFKEEIRRNMVNGVFEWT